MIVRAGKIHGKCKFGAWKKSKQNSLRIVLTMMMAENGIRPEIFLIVDLQDFFLQI